MNNDDANLGMPAVDPQQMPVASPVQYTAPTVAGGTPATAEDIDLIEKEWVEKAKQIVHSTQGDPYAQSQRLGEMKIDYIRKRYNREVKADTSRS